MSATPDTLLDQYDGIEPKYEKERHGEVIEPELPNEPAPLRGAAYHGLAGEIVKLIEPHSEADPAAILLQFLAAYGSAIGRNSYWTAEADRHYGNLFVAIVFTYFQ